MVIHEFSCDCFLLGGDIYGSSFCQYSFFYLSGDKCRNGLLWGDDLRW